MNPHLILELAERFAHYRQAEIDMVHLVEPVSVRELTQKWRIALAQAREQIGRLPADEVGCAYLDSSGHPVDPVADDRDFDHLRRHTGSVGGAWPRIGL